MAPQYCCWHILLHTSVIDLDFVASKLIRNLSQFLWALFALRYANYCWRQLCGVCVFYCRCCKFDQLLTVHWGNIFVYSRWRESKRCLHLGLNSLAENVLEMPELSMLQDIGWRSTDPCRHRFSQSMTVDTPASGIESLLPWSGTSYKYGIRPPTWLHWPHYVKQQPSGYHPPSSQTPSANEILSRLLPCTDSPGIKRWELRHPAKFTNIEPYGVSGLSWLDMQTFQECSTCRAWHGALYSKKTWTSRRRWPD